MPRIKLSHWYKKIGGPGDIVEVSEVEAKRIVTGKGGTLVAEAAPEKPADPEPPVDLPPEGSDEPEGDEAPVEPEADPEPEKPKRSRKK